VGSPYTCGDRACEPSGVGESPRERRSCARASQAPFIGGTVPKASSTRTGAPVQMYRGHTCNRPAHGQRTHSGTHVSPSDGIRTPVLDGL
jgi:hypothetical protein